MTSEVAEVDGLAFDAAWRRVTEGSDPVEEAGHLISLMTQTEVLGLLDGDLPFWPGQDDMGAGGYYEHTFPAGVVPRLGVPGLQFADGPRGLVIGQATCFPVSMARGATFDPELEARVGDAIGRELAAVGANLFGGVCINLLHHPGWGRAQETYGEDPTLVGEMGAALAQGAQRHVMACVKHFALNSMENTRFVVDVSADDATLHDVYLPHFRRVVDAGVAVVMTAYNAVNGVFCGEHRHLITDVLRTSWGFDGVVISDFVNGLRDPVASVSAGLDVEMPFRQQRAMALPAAVEDGTLPWDAVTASATRILATQLRFDHLRRSSKIDPAAIATPEHRELSLEVARASIVMLRNERDLLPLPLELRRIAVLGSLGAVANLGDGGSSAVRPPEVVTPLDGIRAAFSNVEVLHSDDDVSVTDDSDVVIVFVGLTSADEGECVTAFNDIDLSHLEPPRDHPELGVDVPLPPIQRHAGLPGNRRATFARGGDRRDLRLPPGQDELVERALATNLRTIVVVTGGSAVVMPWANGADAVLYLWYPGMAGGTALGEVLAGTVAPGGRLPFAIPRADEDLPPWDPDARSVEYGPLHGQWWLSANATPAAFPFGFGLTTSAWSIDDATFDQEGRLRTTVTNHGGRDIPVVVQAYTARDSGPKLQPHRRLAGFARTAVAAGATVEFDVPVFAQLVHGDVLVVAQHAEAAGVTAEVP